MGDDDDGVRIARQVGLEPERAFEIQVVGRLVEQQQVGLGKEHARQRHAHAPAAREGRTGLQLLVVVKAQPLEDRGRARLGRPGVDVREPGLHLGDAVGLGRGLGLGHETCALGVGGQHRVEQRGLGGRHLLRHAADAGAAGQGDRAGVQHQFAADQFEQGGLARAVGADEAHLVTFGNRRRGLDQKRAAFDGIEDVLNLQHGRAMPQRQSAVNVACRAAARSFQAIRAMLWPASIAIAAGPRARF